MKPQRIRDPSAVPFLPAGAVTHSFFQRHEVKEATLPAPLKSAIAVQGVAQFHRGLHHKVLMRTENTVVSDVSVSEEEMKAKKEVSHKRICNHSTAHERRMDPLCARLSTKQ
jgi:hypothetical protein